MNYLLLALFVLSLFGIFSLLVLFKIINLNKSFNKSFNKKLNYIYPNQLEELCGNGTKPEGQQCVPDNDFVAAQLIRQKFIRENAGEIVFTPDINFDNNVKEVPNWFYYWTDNGSYSCQTKIIDGVCNINENNCHSFCQSGDCAGWRGGNINDCNNTDVGGGRVSCDSLLCECSYGHCAVNGLCVSPYIMDGTKNSKRCCPKCSWKSPDKLGGCSGGAMCDPNIECDEAIVELPGWIKYNPNLADHRVVKVDTLCSDINSTEECYHPNHVNAMKRQEYIVVKPDSSWYGFSALCPEDTNTASGENEYECANKCGDTNGVFSNDQTVDSQVECSKRCLPKLWRWYPVFEKLSNTSELRYTGGYYQSDELMRYLDSDIELRTCPDNTCETELSEPIDFTQFNNCTECNQCLYKYSEYKNNNGFQDMQYNCDSCKQCILDLKDGQQVICKNMVNCNTCRNAVDDIQGIDFNECDTCEGALENDVTAGCKVYTRDPYVDRGNSIDYHSDSEIYNHGGDPYKNTKTPGYSPENRCRNTLDGDKIGWGDSNLIRSRNDPNIVDCTESCNILYDYVHLR
jgi:hypothetical protein